MADKVITVTSPSVVTNDTLASYNNYSDQDGLLGSMTPAEASAGKTVTLSDGVVHQVTTKPVGTTNGEFSAVVSNAVSVDLTVSGYPAINTYAYASKSLSLSAQGIAKPYGHFLSSDKTKLYVQENDDSIYQYNMSVAGDLSTATYSGNSFLFNGVLNNASNAYSLTVSSDGTKFYLVDYQSRQISQIDLSIPWDISTASWNTIISPALIGTGLACVWMNPTQSFIYAVLGSVVTRMPIATPGDITTVTTATTVTFDATAQCTTIYGIWLNDDGTKMYLLDTSSVIYQYTLSTPYDPSTATYDSLSLDLSTEDADTRNIWMDGTSLYVTGNTNDSVYQYDS